MDAGSGGPGFPSRIVFIHIPKTAGTTLQSVLQSNAVHPARLANVFKGKGGRLKEPDYGRMAARMQRDDGVDLYWGHTPFAVASFVPPGWDAAFVTFLRDPVDRAISHYYHLVERLERLAADGSGDEAASRHHRPPKAKVIRGEFSLDIPYETALSDTAFVADNLQTRMLCGLPQPFGEMTDEMLERAIENLDRFNCVGLTERFDESLVLLKHRTGCQSIVYHDQRVNSGRPRGASVPEELRQAAEAANTFDRELYRHAMSRFESAPERVDPEFQLDLAALRSAKANGKAPSLDAPPGHDAASWSALVEERLALMRSRAATTARRREPTTANRPAPDRETIGSSAAEGGRKRRKREGPTVDAPPRKKLRRSERDARAQRRSVDHPGSSGSSRSDGIPRVERDG